VANGLFYVYSDSAPAAGQHISVYADNYLAMPGASVQLTSYLTNGRYEKAGYAPASNIDYEIVEGGGAVSKSGRFTAGPATGSVRIRAAAGGLESFVKIDVYSAVTLTPSQRSIYVEPGQTVDVNVSAVYGYAPIAHSDALFTWECDELAGAVDGAGVFTASARTGVAGSIRIRYGSDMVSIPVNVGPPIVFTDLLDPLTGLDHWAKPYVEALAAKGMVNGVAENLFAPDSPLTRAQFLAMLAKTVDGLDVAAAPPTAFLDVPQAEWYFGYVNWGYNAGVVRGLDEATFAPDAQITREQMAVMLDNFAARAGIAMPPLESPPAFADAGSISDWSAAAVDRVVRSGVMNGLPDNCFGPQGVATRAQAAKVTLLASEMGAAPLQDDGLWTPAPLPAATPGAIAPGGATPGAVAPGGATPGAVAPGEATPGALGPGSAPPAAAEQGAAQGNTPGNTPAQDGDVMF
jgi:hypothetical protein